MFLRSRRANGSLLITDVEVQAVACANGVEQFLELAGRGRLGPCGPPALQRDPGGKPGAYRAERPGPGRCRRRCGGGRPPSLRGRPRAAVLPYRAAAGFSANQAAQQKLNAQLTRAWWRRIAVSERTWKSAQPSWSLTCL